MLEIVKSRPLVAVLVAAALIAGAVFIFGPETVQGWLEAIYEDVAGGETAE